MCVCVVATSSACRFCVFDLPPPPPQYNDPFFCVYTLNTEHCCSRVWLFESPMRWSMRPMLLDVFDCSWRDGVCARLLSFKAIAILLLYSQLERKNEIDPWFKLATNEKENNKKNWLHVRCKIHARVFDVVSRPFLALADQWTVLLLVRSSLCCQKIYNVQYIYNRQS